METNKWEFFPIPRTLYPIPKQLFLLLLLILAQISFSQGLSKNCFDELLAVPDKKKDFDLQGFLTKDLPAEVVKVKAQMKLPFGKPKDDKVTDIGVTVGCLKGFPENADQIQYMLKDVGLEMAKRGANITNGSIVSKFAVQPALKECDAVFNPKKRFCYDGGIYDLCDEMPYNPTTHICSDSLLSVKF